MENLKLVTEREYGNFLKENSYLFNNGKISRKWDKELKGILKSIMKKEKISFTYTHRINDAREFGVMFFNDFERYRAILRRCNYSIEKEYYDVEFTKEVDVVFAPRVE